MTTGTSLPGTLSWALSQSRKAWVCSRNGLLIWIKAGHSHFAAVTEAAHWRAQ
jgi:hypothetical protein